jgi:hypothetical protein
MRPGGLPEGDPDSAPPIHAWDVDGMRAGMAPKGQKDVAAAPGHRPHALQDRSGIYDRRSRGGFEALRTGFREGDFAALEIVVERDRQDEPVVRRRSADVAAMMSRMLAGFGILPPDPFSSRSRNHELKRLLDLWANATADSSANVGQEARITQFDVPHGAGPAALAFKNLNETAARSNSKTPDRSRIGAGGEVAKARLAPAGARAGRVLDRGCSVARSRRRETSG